eukprot:925531-Rhodomonas_salina.1
MASLAHAVGLSTIKGVSVLEANDVPARGVGLRLGLVRVLDHVLDARVVEQGRRVGIGSIPSVKPLESIKLRDSVIVAKVLETDPHIPRQVSTELVGFKIVREFHEGSFLVLILNGEQLPSGNLASVLCLGKRGIVLKVLDADGLVIAVHKVVA